MESENYIEILVKSSSGEPYTVSFNIDKNDISAFCSCQAGTYRILCKHVIGVIGNDDSVLYDEKQKIFMKKICAHLQNTKIPLLFSEWQESEEILKRAQKNAKKSKKILKRQYYKNEIKR